MSNRTTKHKALYFATGFLAATVLTSSMTTLAAPVKKQIEAYFNNTKIYVDGKLVKAKDGNGNAVEPLVYNGTTYLPVRAVGEALNSKVTWDGPKNSVYVGRVNASDVDVSLSNLDYLSESHRYQWGHLDWKAYTDNQITSWHAEDDRDNTGVNYDNGLLFELKGSGTGATHGLESEREYLLNQKYKSFQGSFVLHYDSRSSEDANAVLKVYGDDKLLHTSETLTKGTLPHSFNIDVTGINKLKLVVTNTESDMDYSDQLYFGLVNAGFKK